MKRPIRLHRRPRRSVVLRAAAAVLTAVGLAVPVAATAQAPASAAPPVAVTIQRTAHGVPHITAKDFTSLGYGYGYAFAQDDICVMADDYVTVDAQRSRWFEPDGSYVVRGNGTTPNNLDSDVFWQDIIDSRVIDRLLAVRSGPGALKPEVRQLVRGYVGGYNRWLHDIGGPNGITDPACHGKAWVHPITQAEAFRRFYQLVLLASGDVVISGIAHAQPPAAGVVPSTPSAAAALDPQRIARALLDHGIKPEGALGSNAVAVGSAGTRDHRHGLLLGNPHFPWLGTERFYQAQLTIPGKFNVEGVSLYGVPLILIGHTANMAWSHTVSTAYRFTPYQLTLVPGSPTTYLVDGKPEPMTSRTVRVQSRAADGSPATVTRTLWSTRYGKVFDDLVGVPLPWTTATAFALADANADNFRVFNHFFETDRAQSAAQELRILQTYVGIPWVNTIVADRGGQALYADVSVVPHVTDAEAQQCDTGLGAATFKLLGLPVLDGSRTACAWGSDADAPRPGIFGGSHLPHLFRSDYVTNSNDSYWLANPHHPLTGYARIIGDTATARSLRTRIGLIMTQQRVSGTDGLGPRGFTRADMQRMVFNDRQYGGELVGDQLVAMCRSFPGGMAPTSSGGPVPVGSSCDVLAHWDRTENLGSRGALLFRAFWERALALQEGPWSQPFDAAHPVSTPYGLNTSDPRVQQAYGDALVAMAAARIPVDGELGRYQYVVRHGQRIPIHGGPGDPDGDFNAQYADVYGHPGQDPSLGSSYVQVVTWHDARGCPDARTIVTYSQSQDPTSPWYADQTRLYSRKQWVPEAFCAAAVRAATIRTTVLHGQVA